MGSTATGSSVYSLERLARSLDVAPHRERYCSYEKSYKHSEAALIGAREFVERDIAKGLLMQILEEWLQTDLIGEKEYQQAQDSVYARTHPANRWKR